RNAVRAGAPAHAVASVTSAPTAPSAQVVRAPAGGGVTGGGRNDDQGLCVLTQNIDGFHRAAGSRNLIEIHGDIHDLLCTRCDYRGSVPDYAALTLPPSCPRCQAPVRPRVVLFGEMLPSDAIAHLYRELDLGFDLVFSIGTTSVFPYIAGPVVQARQAGIPTVEINPTDTNVTAFVDYKLAAGAAVSLRAIREAYGPPFAG
uniref:SIR2 family NAD-dependent protein deacylase n=1 Tax=uncultured Thiodictyon sp. TaxID=1846217 RepID=UPI0025FF2FF1